MADVAKVEWDFSGLKVTDLGDEIRDGYVEALGDRTDVEPLKLLGTQTGKTYTNYAILVRFDKDDTKKLGICLLRKGINVRDNSVKFTARVMTLAI